MNKRLSERIDLRDKGIPVKITTNGEITYIGTLNDLSEIGLSFHSDTVAVLPTLGDQVNISFRYNGAIHRFELEILRETPSSDSYLNAGKFIGLASRLKRQKRLLMEAAVNEQELVSI